MTSQEILSKISQCDITYHIPGKSDRSAMPIGDGELCASVWVQDGEICMYLSRSDARTEYDRTVKLGMVRVSLSPNPFSLGKFCQTLRLTQGEIQIFGEGGNVVIWIEKETHSLRMDFHFSKEISIIPQFVCWRTEKNIPCSEFDINAGIYETADIVIHEKGGIGFFHENGETIVEKTAQLEGLGDCISILPDEISGRIFGGYLIQRETDSESHVAIVTHSAQTSRDDFLSAVRNTATHLSSPGESRRKSSKRWQEYWTKSYIFVEGDPEIPFSCAEDLLPYTQEPMEYTCQCVSSITRAYTLTKYMTACCADGAFPILYNGMLFNLCPGNGEHFQIQNFGRCFTSQPAPYTLEINPDERSWCTEHLWQNVRHPYHSLLARGETDSMKVLFRYYRRFWELDRERAKRYYGAKGQHNTEMTLSFGLQSMGIYGTDRTGKPDGYSENRWGGAVDISPGLELCFLMFDYYDHTHDDAFLWEEALPYLKELLEYVASRFSERENGKIRIGPINAVETYWETINPLPIVAGMKSCVARALSLIPKEDPLAQWLREYQSLIPDLPREQELLLPAEEYHSSRKNVEIPELYAIFPFRILGADDETLELARNTYWVRTKQFDIHKAFQISDAPGSGSYSGWQYLGVVAALLGMKEEAGKILCDNCALQNPGTRFPAMWGPIYDAVPDTDHGANILHQLQTMILQRYGNNIHLLKAFPKDWKVSFKLYADQQTTVEGTYDGRTFQYSVLPSKTHYQIQID